MAYLLNYLLFLFKCLSILAVILVGFAGLLALSQKNKQKERLRILPLNEKYTELYLKLAKQILPNKEFKVAVKETKKANKELTSRPRCFVLPFNGDIRASHVKQLRESITAVLTLATPADEVIVTLESPGGAVNGYGLAAAQLARVRAQGIPLTVIVDKVAASGGYLMAAVANKILAAPFAIIGSIGVLAQLPNFHRFLKHHHIDFEQITAGEFKRTLSVFGENTKKGREKMQQELEEIHTHFKDYLQQYRPQLDLAQVATGEYWLGQQALALRLVDGISTSDDYLITLQGSHQLIEISHEIPKSWLEKMTQTASISIKEALLQWNKKSDDPTLL